MKRPTRSHKHSPAKPVSAQKPATKASAPTTARNVAAPAFSIPGVQRKLAVGKSDSPFEREADNVADSVVSGSPAPAITPLPAGGLGAHAQRMEAEKDDETEDVAQTKSEEEEPEEEPAQMKAAEEEMTPEEEEPLQAKSADDAEMDEEKGDQAQAKTDEKEEEVLEEEPAQTMAEEEAEEEEEEDETAQAKAGGRAGERDRTKTADAIRNPGTGRALPSEVRRPIERATGADLGDVRVHDDGRAASAAHGVGARAFTHGRDIWLGAGESARDTRLMAHEAAHVVQQTGRHGGPARAGGGAPGGPSQAIAGSGGAAPVQRTEDDDNAGDPPGVSTANGSTLDIPAGTLSIPTLRLPNLAGGDSATFPVTASKPGQRSTNQRLTWLQGMVIEDQGVEAATPEDKAVDLDPGGKNWFLRLRRSSRFLIGSRENIKTAARLPNWRENGVFQNFQVDHVVEDQIGGSDSIDNYQLLDPATNRAKGGAIRESIRGEIRDAMAAHRRKHPRPRGEEIDHYSAIRGKNPDQIRGLLDVTFEAKGQNLNVNAPEHVWSEEQVRKGEHLAELTPTNDESIIPPLGSDVELVILTGEAGGAPIRIPLRDGQPQLRIPTFFFGGVNNLIVVGAQFSPGSLALESRFRVKGQIIQDIDAPLSLTNVGNPYTFQLPSNLMETGLVRRLNMPKASPITVNAAAISGGGLQLGGTLAFSSPLFEGVTADVSIDGEDVSLSKTFEGGDFDIPGPVDVTGTSLTISIGTTGGQPDLSLAGSVEFEVNRVGKGVLRGMGSLVNGVAVEGEFDFDPALFKGADARITVGYADDTFTGTGTIKIGEDQIKGIKSAELNVTVTDDLWVATGTVEPKIPGVSQGTLAMQFDPDGGFEIAGELILGEGIPRLKSGKLDAKLVKEGEAYKVSASGDAELDIPGVDAKLSASYDDGKFKAEASVAYARGIASGEVTVGATNLPVDPETGQFTDGEPTENVTVYGSGSVTIQFTPWLQGTAGLKIKPDGSMEVHGRVALPDTVEVFPEKKLEKELLSVSADLPIVGVAVAGQRIGIFLNITGGLTAKASVGPGELKDVAVDVSYDPEDESSARITGSARFEVPAEAGLRLTIQGALGAGIPVVSARAGLELGAELGITALASASAEVEWTPATGINMEANIGISASPQFTFDVAGFADVTADLVLDEIELYSKRWELASFTYGSGMAVGANLKVQVENNEFKPISMEDVELTTPDIDPMAMIRGVTRQVF